MVTTRRRAKLETNGDEAFVANELKPTPRKSRKRVVTPESSWFSDNPSKRRGEIFFLWYHVFWVLFVGAIIVTQVYESFGSNEYMLVGIIVGVPCIVWPLIFPGEDAAIPWHERYTTKANAWIFIMAWVANWFWTHYFYEVLGAAYTFPAWRLNDVPFCLYLMSHSYFMLYHSFSTIVLRRAWRVFDNKTTAVSLTAITLLVVFKAYFWAATETLSISTFPYYSFRDRTQLYTLGMGFYAIYFLASFPMFFRIDERRGDRWSMSRTLIDACANCMLITQGLDLWRVFVGPIFSMGAGNDSTTTVPFISSVAQ